MGLGVGALGLPRVNGIAMQTVFATQAVLAIFLLLLAAALFLLFAFLAAIAHGKIIIPETSVREWRDVADGFAGTGVKRAFHDSLMAC
jgi:hypothetical protein